MEPDYIFIINNRSGSRKGEEMEKLLHNLDVKTYNMYKLSKSIDSQNELYKLIKKNTVICIAAGDGSISWSCSIIDNLRKDKEFPKICIVPMGTGNDLSRTLGWGIKNLSYHKTIQLLEKIKICLRLDRVSSIDWWEIEYLDYNKKDKKKIKKLPIKMLCYLSFGYDAKITYNYQNDRNSDPEKFNSQLYNKLMYIKHGVGGVLNSSPKVDVKLNCNDKNIDIPLNCKSLKLLNINSAASGVYFWGKMIEEHYDIPKINDNKLEIISSYGLYNLIGLNIGISTVDRLSQSSKIIIDIKEGEFMQIDGEGFEMPKCKIKVSRFKQIPIIIGYKKSLGTEENIKDIDIKIQKAVTEYKKDYFKNNDNYNYDSSDYDDDDNYFKMD
jgi:diacylglycerol kinase (ATP)